MAHPQQGFSVKTGEDGPFPPLDNRAEARQRTLKQVPGLDFQRTIHCRVSKECNYETIHQYPAAIYAGREMAPSTMNSSASPPHPSWRLSVSPTFSGVQFHSSFFEGNMSILRNTWKEGIVGTAPTRCCRLAAIFDMSSTSAANFDTSKQPT